jgi:uncharacterized membrane protein
MAWITATIGYFTSSVLLRISHSFPLLIYGTINKYNKNRTSSFPCGSVFNIPWSLSRVRIRVFAFPNSRLGLGFFTLYNLLESPHVTSSTCVRNESWCGIHLVPWWSTG